MHEDEMDLVDHNAKIKTAIVLYEKKLNVGLNHYI